jgi:hypothetical protein
MGGEPGDHRDAEPVHIIGELVRSGPSMPGSTRTNPSSPRTMVALLQTHSLCRTQTPSATSFSIGSPCQVSTSDVRRDTLRIRFGTGRRP